MDSITLAKFKNLFEEQKMRLVNSFEMASESFSLSQDEKYDEADLSSHELESSMRMRLKSREALYLKKINEAIRRISEGCFGECEECGDDIELRRLEVRPTATLCLGCKEEEERREQIHIDGHKHKSVGIKLKLA
ncbi:MAG: TraR/DksA family transcriptional regulator [Bdellovibrionia bacterium]